MRLFQTPKWLQKSFRSITWKIPQDSKCIYLTFDDGPIPEVTPWVLKTLELYQAKATFFCVGENIEKYPEIKSLVQSKGHRLGNHTFHHLNGWKTTNETYFRDIHRCSEYLDSSLFRPPYGKLTPSQYNHLKTKYELVFWDLISYDFDKSLPPEKCLEILIKKTEAGSIVVFHDSLKSFENLLWVLPRYLEFFQKQGYQFLPLP